MARLFTVREYDGAWKHMMSEVMDAFRDLDPLLSRMPTATVRHRGPIRNVSGPEPLDQELKSIEADSVLQHDDVRSFNVDAHTAFMHDLVDGMVRGIAGQIYETMSAVTEHTGNVVDAKGQKLTPDLLLDTIEKMDIPFDDEGNPLMPTLLMAPEAAKQLTEMPFTDAHEERRQAILERKREQFLAQKRTRRIR